MPQDFSEQALTDEIDLIRVASVFTHIDFERAKLLFCRLFDCPAPGGSWSLLTTADTSLQIRVSGALVLVTAANSSSKAITRESVMPAPATTVPSWVNGESRRWTFDWLVHSYPFGMIRFLSFVANVDGQVRVS